MLQADEMTRFSAFLNSSILFWATIREVISTKRICSLKYTTYVTYKPENNPKYWNNTEDKRHGTVNIIFDSNSSYKSVKAA